MKPWDQGYGAPKKSSGGKPWDKTYSPQVRSVNPEFIPREGETEDEMIQRIAAERIAKLREEGTINKMDPSDRFMVGMGAGADRVIRNVGNMLGLVSDEDLEAQQKYYDDIATSRDANIGMFAGETAAVTPIAMGAPSVLAKTLGTVGKSAGKVLGGMGRNQRLAAETVKEAGKRAATEVSKKTYPGLLRATGRGMTEGAVEGAILAGPDQRMGGGIIGGTLGGGMGALAGGIGRL